jgi:hypothetical protein
MQQRDKTTTALEGKVDDLIRQNRHLTHLLRLHGISPEGVQDVGETNNKKAA